MSILKVMCIEKKTDLAMATWKKRMEESTRIWNTVKCGCKLILLVCCLPLATSLAGQEVDSPEVFELEAFVVYGGTIDVVDGFTGEPYTKENAVVEAFREDFNKLLLNYHRWMLRNEATFMKQQIAENEAMVTAVESLAAGFGIEEIAFSAGNHLVIERAIFNRLVQDPFFRIDALVVWEESHLERLEGQQPLGLYAQDIRYNEEKKKWERRVTTRWEVSIRTGAFDALNIVKEQGLNLDTNRGYHFINRPLTPQVQPASFQHVKLTYPIIVNTREPVEQQVERLKRTFLTNLTHIYDPFSWFSRRNVRFRGGFQPPLLRAIRATRIRLSDRDWLDPVLANFISDVVTIQRKGIGEIYDLSLLRRIPVNNNLLGEGLDLLNWHSGESRSVDYDPKTQGSIGMNFDHPDGARFIILEAYSRNPEAFIENFRTQLAQAGRGSSGKEIVKDVIESVTGESAEDFIPKAGRIQKEALDRYRYNL
jgi:hypothetical protein